jgi:hypothetical protein
VRRAFIHAHMHEKECVCVKLFGELTKDDVKPGFMHTCMKKSVYASNFSAN